MDLVERYLAAIRDHDWAGLATVLTDDVVRVGPFGDTYTGRDEYVRFLAELMPALPGYAMDVARVTYTADSRRAFAELTETVAVDGTPTLTREVLVFDLVADRVERVEIYIRRA